MVMTAALLLPCSGPSGNTPATPTVPPPIASTPITLDYFGYAAIACDLDDPFDSSPKTEYSDEVAAFTNANQVCVTDDADRLAQRLRETAALYTPVFYVEPIFFEFAGNNGQLSENAETLWAFVKSAITSSNVVAEDIIFYIVDEPSLRGLPLDDVNKAVEIIKRDYPAAQIMMIEAFQSQAPTIPTAVDIWGFNAYTIRDPASDRAYVNHLDLAASQLKTGQSLALIMDAQHTPIHLANRLTEDDMAEVARNYYTLAQSRDDISIMLGYTLVGGIDNDQEKGVRNLLQTVQQAHREIGRKITQKSH